MESINLKYIIFAVIMLVFYLIRRGLSAKVKETQKNQEQQPLNKKIHEMLELKEDADESAKLSDREIAVEESALEESIFDDNSEEYDELEEQSWEAEANEKKKKVIEELEEVEKEREVKKEVRSDYEKRDKIINYDYQKTDFSNPSVEDLRNAIIWSEILAPPVSERDD